jgi:hypothetical protein
MLKDQDPGCRDAALATLFLLGVGIAMFASGLALINRAGGCAGSCEFFGIAMLYAGGPISALIGAFSDTVVVAWPLDVTLWVILGFWTARRAAAGRRSTMAYALMILLAAVAYGLVLSQFVELVL